MSELVSRLLAALASLLLMVATVATVALALVGSAAAAGDTAVALLTTPAAATRVASLLSDYTDLPIADDTAGQVHAAAQRATEDPAVVAAARQAAADIWTAQFVTAQETEVDLTAVLTAVRNQLGVDAPGFLDTTQTVRFTPLGAMAGPEPLARVRTVRLLAMLGALVSFAASLALMGGTWARRLRRGGITVATTGVVLGLTSWVATKIGAGIGALVASRLLPIAVTLAVGGAVLILASILVALSGRSGNASRRTSRDRQRPPAQPAPAPAAPPTPVPAPLAAPGVTRVTAPPASPSDSLTPAASPAAPPAPPVPPLMPPGVPHEEAPLARYADPDAGGFDARATRSAPPPPCARRATGRP